MKGKKLQNYNIFKTPSDFLTNVYSYTRIINFVLLYTYNLKKYFKISLI